MSDCVCKHGVYACIYVPLRTQKKGGVANILGSTRGGWNISTSKDNRPGPSSLSHGRMHLHFFFVSWTNSFFFFFLSFELVKKTKTVFYDEDPACIVHIFFCRSYDTIFRFEILDKKRALVAIDFLRSRAYFSR